MQSMIHNTNVIAITSPCTLCHDAGHLQSLGRNTWAEASSSLLLVLLVVQFL